MTVKLCENSVCKYCVDTTETEQIQNLHGIYSSYGLGAEYQVFLKTFVCLYYIILLPSPYGRFCLWLRANRTSFGGEFTGKSTVGTEIIIIQ